MLISYCLLKYCCKFHSSYPNFSGLIMFFNLYQSYINFFHLLYIPRHHIKMLDMSKLLKY